MKDWLNEGGEDMYYALIVTGIIFGATLYQTMKNAKDIEEIKRERHADRN